MPIIDAPGRGRERLRVPKSDLDPFGQRRQALRLARERGPAPGGRDTASLDYSAEDRGDHFVITIEPEGAAGVSGDRRPEPSGQRPRGGGLRSMNVRAAALSVEPAPTPSEARGMAPDVASVLSSSYAENELRTIARRHGAAPSRTAGKREVVEDLLRVAPARARDMAGRL